MPLARTRLNTANEACEALRGGGGRAVVRLRRRQQKRACARLGWFAVGMLSAGAALLWDFVRVPRRGGAALRQVRLRWETTSEVGRRARPAPRPPPKVNCQPVAAISVPQPSTAALTRSASCVRPTRSSGRAINADNLPCGVAAV